MKKLLICILFMTQQAQAIIVNYTKLVSPNGEKTVHLFADMHIPNKKVAESQAAAIAPFLLKNRNAILYIDGYMAVANRPSEIADMQKKRY